MPFSVVSKKSGKTYYLHARKMKNSTSNMHFFAGDVKPGALDKLPDGYKVIENERTGLPMLKKA